MENVINTQLNLVLEEIELISDTYQRADIRVKLIAALAGLTLENSEPVGKEAFKNDIVKDTTKEEIKTEVKDKAKKQTKKQATKKEEVKRESTKEEAPIVFEPAVKEEPKPKEIDLEGPQEDNMQPVIISCKDEEGVTYELDITEAWSIVGDDNNSEDAKELAKGLTEYNLLPIYNTFTELDNSYNKMMLSYYLQEFSLETINEFVNDLTDGNFNNIYEFANNENLEGLIASIEDAASE